MKKLWQENDYIYRFSLVQAIDTGNEEVFHKQDDFAQLDERLYQLRQNIWKIYII